MKTYFLLASTALLSLAGASEIDFRNYRLENSPLHRENIEWHSFYSYNALDKKSPRALLVGDSICRGYQGAVREILGKKVNITYWATSNCITDPFYLQMLEMILAREKFDIIIFNNGLHSLSTDKKAWRKAFSLAMDYLARRVPATRVVVLNSTPKRDGDPRVKELNQLAESVAKEKNLAAADIYSLCVNWNKKEWSDRYHFNKKGRQQQAEFVANVILKYIGRTADDLVQKSSETGPDGKIK
jgi:hypothetical protein